MPNSVADQATSQAESRILQLGRELHQRTRNRVPGIFDRSFWQGKLMDWAMSDPSFKVDLFRFVDVLPALQTTDQIATHIREYLLKPGRSLPTVMTAALKLASGGITSGLGARAIRKNVTEMAERFIVGTSAAEALPVLRSLHAQGYAFTVDLLGEATTSILDAETYAARYLELIDDLPQQVAAWPVDDLIDHDDRGPIPRCNVSIKLSALEPHLDAVDPIGSVERVWPRILPLLLRAKQNNVFINIDMEQWSLNSITYDVFERVAKHPELRDWPHLGVVVQAYLRESSQHVDRLRALAVQRATPLTVRLVKGAYWDYEVVNARQNGLSCPVFDSKADTDLNFERLTAMLMQHSKVLRPALASHNLRSLTNALVQAELWGVPRRAFEVQMLYGMAEPERAALREIGCRTRLYAPVGELLPGMAYLVRRLLENTSNDGFLKLSHHDQVDIDHLLAAPQVKSSSPVKHDAAPVFSNASLTDFADKTQRLAFADAVQAARTRGVIDVPAIVNGTPVDALARVKRECPSDPSRVVAAVAQSTAAVVDFAVRSGHAAWPQWRDRPLAERAGFLRKLAALLERDRYELAALQTMEVGKPWREADADVAEAIDFCRYYADRAQIELAEVEQGRIAGEHNLLRYEGRGVVAVIAPWNFPLAILTGMAAAALVAGNAVVLKPAEQSSAIALGLYRRLVEAGFDARLVQFLPGSGEVAGAALVVHPLVAGIAFTGSMSVGTKILQAAAVVQPGQPQLKRVVCELGGKNAIIVDDDADLDDAVIGIIKSAFGFAGQKCSAASRVIVVGQAYPVLCARLIEATRSLVVAAADDPACVLGPVVDRDAYERLMRVPLDRAGVKVLHHGELSQQSGYFVPPLIVEVEKTDDPLFCDELFGPVVAVTRAADFETALTIANQSVYKLTGAVFSRSPAHLERARQAFRVGNLYLNRGSTGALVGRQPFGGFGMSGLGTKAGGPNYLLNFVDPRVITENTMRRGVASDPYAANIV